MTWSSTYVLLVFICIYILKILGELSTYLRKSVLKHIATLNSFAQASDLDYWDWVLICSKVGQQGDEIESPAKRCINVQSLSLQS